MEIALVIVIGLQFAFLVYSDIQNRIERERLELKLMSKDVNEYKYATEETPQDSKKEEEDPYQTLEDSGVEQILRAKEIE